MTLSIPDLFSWVLLCSGSFFLVTGALGLVRMPDVFTRMHAASVMETLGVGLILVGLMVQAGFTLVTVKLICLLLLIFFTAPVASHSIARAAMADGVEPKLDGPKLDAREGQIKPFFERTKKLTTPIDAGEAESAASVLVEEGDIQPDKGGPS